MGQASLIATVAIAMTMMLFMYTTQQTSRDTQDAQNEAFADKAARDLANHGKKLVLASWLESEGKSGVAPFNTINKDGGTISVSNFNLNSNILDVTIRGTYDGAVHDVRSRYQWNSLGLNPFQIKAADLNFNISSSSELNISNITLDDQSLSELDEVLIQDLGLANDLSELDLGANDISNDLSSSLTGAGKSNIGIDMIDAAQRAQLEQENGMYFPDQVEQAINTYINANPSLETTASNNTIPTSFGMDSGNEVLRITDDLTVTNLEGQGILIVEGNLNVPAGATLNWNGLILVKPPAENMNPQLNLSGTVDLNGGLIALHDAMPNSGHMDITSFRDYSGSWSNSAGNEYKLARWGWRWCLYHRHDFTSAYGNSIRYYANSSSERIHESQHYMHETLQSLNGNDQVFFELYNTAAHGRGSLSMEVQGDPLVFYPVSAGFEPTYADPTNAYRTKTFMRSHLRYLHLDITRLSSLKKMWDTGERYPGCSSTSGPLCVGYNHNRMETLTLRLYKMNGVFEQRIWEVSMYWHRRTDEIEEYEKNMEELVDEIKSPSYGMDVTIGSGVTFTGDPNALSMLNVDGAPLGYVHLGTWHSHWSKDHPKNPL